MKKIGIIAGVAAIIGVAAAFIIKMTGKNPVRESELMISDFHSKAFGENVFFFKESDDHTLIQKTVDSIYEKMETNQFGKERYALCFFPGDYSDITVNVGFYTQVLGLGAMPTDVKIGKLVCSAGWLGDDSNHNATQNFWRSVENVEILSNTMWAVSQATDMRRVQIDGSLYLHDNYGWASGGFLSDSRVLGMIDSGSQQQWLSRNDQYRTWMNENWNIVFAGDEPSGLPTGTWPVKAYTSIAEVDEIKEKPFLLWTDPESFNDLGVCVPKTRTGATGISWAPSDDIDYADFGWDADVMREYALKHTPATFEKLADFPEYLGRVSGFDEWYIAFSGSDTAASINDAIGKGKNILFTPGVYELSEPVVVSKSETVLLGLGLATLKAASGNVCITTKGDGITVAGLLFDAGPAVTDTDGNTHISGNLLHIDEGRDIMISDVFFRVGGTPASEPAVADCCITIDADHVIGDNLWVWRADHGDQVAWDKNVTKNGIVINGNDVTMYALMVEHFHEYQTVWNGERGRLYMYQSEVPYDVPADGSWMSHDGKRSGYSSILVNDSVKDFHGEGIGIYLYNRDNPVKLESAVEMPDRKGVSIHHIITVMLSGNPGMMHVINDVGNSVVTPGAEAILIDYENGIYK